MERFSLAIQEFVEAIKVFNEESGTSTWIYTCEYREMKVLILGSNGMLGPYVEKALQDDHHLILTDIQEEYEGLSLIHI